MVRRLLSLSLCLLLVRSQVAVAQWVVFDEQAGIQRTLLWLQEAAQWGQSIGNQVKEIEATYNVIIQQVKQYETMVLNLRRIPEGLNFTAIVTQWGGQLSDLLRGATMIGYSLSSVMAQFTALYEDLGTLQNSADIFALRHRLLSGRMEAAALTTQVTALQGQASELYGRICALLDQSIQAAGNLEIQQIQAQQNGLMQQQLQALNAMQATHARNTAQSLAEQAALERVQLQAIQGAMGSANPLGEPRGKLPRARW